MYSALANAYTGDLFCQKYDKIKYDMYAGGAAQPTKQRSESVIENRP